MEIFTSTETSGMGDCYFNSINSPHSVIINFDIPRLKMLQPDGVFLSNADRLFNN